MSFVQAGSRHDRTPPFYPQFWHIYVCIYAICTCTKRKKGSYRSLWAEELFNLDNDTVTSRTNARKVVQ